MNDIPASFKQHLKQTLTGRLKLKLFEAITGSPCFLPDSQQVRHYIIEQYRLNPEIGFLFGILLNYSYADAVKFDLLLEVTNLEKLLNELESDPLEGAFFLEITDCRNGLPASIGAFISWRELADGGYVYVATLLEETTFPNSVVGRVEVRASKCSPEPAFAILGSNGYECYSLENYQDDEFAVFVTKILGFVNQNRHKVLVPLEEATGQTFIEKQATTPPIDQRLQTLLQLVFLNKVVCTQAEVELSSVRPYDIDFCLSYPSNIVETVIQMGVTTRLLVYWHHDTFIMSDDYPDYLAYRKLKYQRVPVVIIGAFPEKMATPTAVGGKELLPPLFILPHPDYSSLPLELKEMMIESRLQKKPLSNIVSRLYGLFLRFSHLIRDPQTKEKELHRFLLEHPISIDPYGIRIESEVRLGAEYRIDLVIQYATSDKRLLLIELERANLQIFTKKGRYRAHVTHAIQQVEDWLRWWRENPGNVPEFLDYSLPVEGLVVIGRSADMDESTKRRLINLNYNRKVQVITYDDLLERIQSLIFSLERIEENA